MSLIDIRSGDRRILGTGGTLFLLAGIVGWTVVGIWLTNRLHFPQSAGSTCRNGCLIDEYLYSRALLGDGWMGRALFVWLWSIPMIYGAAIIVAKSFWRVGRRSQ